MTCWLPLSFFVSVILYYGWLVRVADRSALRLALRLPRLQQQSVSDAEALVNVLVAAAFQLALCTILIAVAGVSATTRRLWQGLHPLHLALAPALAITQLAASGLICALAMQLIRNTGDRAAYSNWVAMMDSGWLRSFMRLNRVVGWRARWLLLLTYVGAEEVLFRILALELLASWGKGAAGVVTCVTFILIQAVGMPTLGHALFPLTGALVMGIAHTWLAIQGMPVLALILGHLIFLGAAVSLTPSQQPPPAQYYR